MSIKRILAGIILIVISSSAFADNKIMLFGGANHDVYLGCFKCSDIESDSIHNDIGRFGSDISSTSIFNDISQYGSDASQYSPCNDTASNPPVLVDKDSRFYG